MRQFECVADKKIYTESQLRQLFQFKVVHGYDNKFENWINEVHRFRNNIIISCICML